MRPSNSYRRHDYTSSSIQRCYHLAKSLEYHSSRLWLRSRTHHPRMQLLKTSSLYHNGLMPEYHHCLRKWPPHLPKVDVHHVYGLSTVWHLVSCFGTLILLLLFQRFLLRHSGFCTCTRTDYFMPDLHRSTFRCF